MTKTMYTENEKYIIITNRARGARWKESVLSALLNVCVCVCVCV